MSASGFVVHGLPAEKARRVSDRVRVPESAVVEAGTQWSATAAALRAGSLDGESRVSVGALRARYTGIRRLTVEARRMIMLSTNPESRRAVYAIDPHLIRGHCSFWDPSKFTGFDFMRQEWNQDEKDERVRFIVYLLGSILRMDHLVCLEAGREEIANMLAEFLDRHAQAPDRDDQLDAFADALEQIRLSVEFSEKLNMSPDSISDFILEKFEALVGTGGIPLMQQQLSAARLAEVLRSKALKGSFFALRAKVEPDQIEALGRAERLFASICNDQEFLRDARTSLYEAYATFGRVGALSERDLVSGDVAEFRSGEFSNINALFEVHLINVCLAEERVAARIRYITDSNLLFNFVSAFQPGVLEAELVHPRHVFIFENRLIDGNLDLFQQVVSAPDAIAEAVSADGKISVEELETFEARFAPTLRMVRQTYSFATIDFGSERRALAEVMRRFIADHGGERAGELFEKLDGISRNLAATSESVREAFKQGAPELSEIGFEAYQEFVEALTGRERANLMLVRRFGVDGRGPDAVPRLVFVPIGGGYRQIVKIYQPDVVRLLGEFDEDVGTMDMPTIIRSIGSILGDAELEGRDITELRAIAALPDYTRALYAMLGREWLLAQTYCKSSLRKLGMAGEKISAPVDRVEGNSPEGRRRLMVQEVLIVQHFARRGIGTNLEGFGRRRPWLRLAAEDLHAAGVFILSVADRGSYTTRHDPNSVRLALAACGLLIEWLALKVTRRRLGRSLQVEAPDPILPAVDDPDVAWSGLGSLTRPLAEGWSDDVAATGLSYDLDELNRRIAVTVAQVRSGGDGGGHSYEFWRFIAARGFALRILLDLMGRLSLIDLPLEPKVARLDAEQLALLAEHEAYMADCRRRFDGVDSPNAFERPHPFNDLVEAAHRLLDLPESADGGTMETRLRRGEILLLISRLQHALSPTGFPRSVSKALLARYGSEAAEQLREVASILERDAMMAGGR